MPEIMIDGNNEQAAWEFQEIQRVVQELHEHHIETAEVEATRTKMEEAGTMHIDHPKFSLTRNLHQGWDIVWHHHPEQSANE